MFLGRPWICQFPALTRRSKDTRRANASVRSRFWFPMVSGFSSIFTAQAGRDLETEPKLEDEACRETPGHRQTSALWHYLSLQV